MNDDMESLRSAWSEELRHCNRRIDYLGFTMLGLLVLVIAWHYWGDEALNLVYQWLSSRW